LSSTVSVPSLFHDIDVVRIGVMVDLAARAVGHEPIEMDVDLLGAERRLMSLICSPRPAPSGWSDIRQMHDLEQ